jgi:phosphoribosylformylglycinamidine synthase
MRNRDLKFICRDATLKVELDDGPFMSGYEKDQTLTIPIAHNEGNYFASDDTVKELQDNGRIAFTYAGDNPNGAVADIAGITNAKGNVLGMMPHPERLAEAALGGEDGRAMFDSLAKFIAK